MHHNEAHIKLKDTHMGGCNNVCYMCKMLLMVREFSGLWFSTISTHRATQCKQFQSNFRPWGSYCFTPNCPIPSPKDTIGYPHRRRPNRPLRAVAKAIMGSSGAGKTTMLPGPQTGLEPSPPPWIPSYTNLELLGSGHVIIS